MKLKNIIIFFIFYLLLNCCSKKTEENKKFISEEKKGKPVKTIIASKKELNDFYNTVGILFPQQKIKISSFNGGIVEKLYFEEGSFVKQNSVLAEIDLKLNQLRLEKLLIEFENVKAIYEKDKILYEKKAIPKLTFINSQSRYESLKNDIEQTKILIDRAIIKAPVEGFIITKNVEENEFVQPGQVICTINKMDYLKIKFEIPEREIKYFKEGKTEIIVSIDAFPYDEPIITKITNISKEINYQNLSYEAEAEIKNPEYKYKSGLLCRLKILKQKIFDSIVLPKDAVLDFEDGNNVFVIEEGIAKLKVVQSGVSEGAFIQIISGIREGEEVVVEGQHNLFDGELVKIEK
ncbi:MAG TPA: efflux RND transporter periplasmic adaptor subunit [bacterium]|nr:efflux RND transporter periplasmic adaptor subunit [bacterium]HOL47910.1 efflux RND transporter periplasmic adaptor subunit [bacterium]HPQ19225.1 efflux RND transporter periplasmic adaptor subunit [bacterium]